MTKTKLTVGTNPITLKTGEVLARKMGEVVVAVNVTQMLMLRQLIQWGIVIIKIGDCLLLMNYLALSAWILTVQQLI